ncbi:MAG: peptidase [Solidesulfovibrio sp.]|uniref:peptidase n=1 Tax=Solidesulfovibrio sp. TaxID=2910990 RepID=UPI002B1F1F5A|nr:peptidase [Solidesulfovibrio sp.]MEA4858577.1 peptidase [Solidesulfovibrio sp.]
MTFCLGITVEEGLVGIADTRITSGNELTSAQKVTTYQNGNGAFFLMTSGLRSVRDKTLTYFDEVLETCPSPFDKLYKAVNAFTAELRRVSAEDKPFLADSGLHFNLHALIGGQLAADASHKLYLVYPEGNWVEISRGTPYHIIGEGGYGKPVLDRTLKFSDSLRMALKVGCLAFDSTRISASDVDFPIDVVLYRKGGQELAQHRYEKQDLADISAWWQEHLRGLVHDLPSEWIDNVASKLTKVCAPPGCWSHPAK